MIGGIFIIIGSGLSNAGGIGGNLVYYKGGGLLMPILVLFLNFETKEAIPICKLMIFTGAFTAFIMGRKTKNPFRNSTAIDYNIAVLVIPAVMFGTIIGVILNKIIPPWLILCCLTFILSFNTFKTFSKFILILNKSNTIIQRGRKTRNKEEKGI